MKIKSILIANRGEIARRVIRTAKKMKIKTVAVYSDADENALFAKEADQRGGLGGKTPLESYLDFEKIVKIALEKKCDAIHPGYGFLSENAKFVKRCREANILFIGPEAETITAMGDKALARKTARELGVPTVPGSEILRSVEEAKAACNNISFPALLKASAGGGGIGMRKVGNHEELPTAFEEASNRAKVAFGDSRVYIEKYLEEPHHIEIQVFCDAEGNVLTFHERECSVQRRYQKIIEESPSTYVTEELREKLREATRKLVRGIGYLNAGTIEFIVDKDRNFYFLEANTRLQVEHPITEVITGLDLVELQIKIASGERLPIEEDDLEVEGWGIESRIYAEDPVRFFPSPGTITKYSEPSGEGIRVDSGYGVQSVISPYYDPLIAKLITHGATRDVAIERMLSALENYSISGIKTNIPFLKEAYASPLFKNGGYDAHFIEKFRKQA
ncbi:ATP-grasp domain-containing protein [Thermodesulfovibrionales bacterium]|nr:ATP-grasp domain-containing protein [Thermodesulfovibrionales bacterium]